MTASQLVTAQAILNALAKVDQLPENLQREFNTLHTTWEQQEDIEALMLRAHRLTIQSSVLKELYSQERLTLQSEQSERTMAVPPEPDPSLREELSDSALANIAKKISPDMPLPTVSKEPSWLEKFLSVIGASNSSEAAKKLP